MDLTTRAGRKEQGRRIQKAAEAAGLSLEELAREIGCSRALLYQYVSGVVLAQSNRLQKIAQRTGHSLTYFFEDEGQEEHDGDPASISAEPGDEAISLVRPEYSSREPYPEPSPAPASAAAGAPATEPSAEVARTALQYLEQLADVLEAHDESQDLLSTCERIVPYARQMQDRLAETRAWLRMGNAHIQKGSFESAQQALKVALSLAEESGDVSLALACRQSLGRAALSAGDTEQAEFQFSRVAAGTDWHDRWQGAVSLAAVHEHRGDYRAALECCDSALEVIESARAPRKALEGARCYIVSNQANVYLACGDFNIGGRLSRELLLAAERSGQREQFVEALINLGIGQTYQGEWDLAEENLLRAIDLAHFTGDLPRWGFARAWLASLLCLAGEVDSSKDEAKDALQTGLETGSRRCEIQAQLSLGEAYLKSGAPREALYHFRQAHRAAVLSSTPAQAAVAIQRCATARFALGDATPTGDASTASSENEQALTQARNLGIQHVEAMALELLARILAQSGEPGRALESAMAAGELSRRLGLTELGWRTAALAANLLHAKQDPERAIAAGAEAIRLLGDLRRRIRRRRGEEALLEDPSLLAPYEAEVRRLLLSGRAPEARSLAEEADWPPLVSWLEMEPASSPVEPGGPENSPQPKSGRGTRG